MLLTLILTAAPVVLLGLLHLWRKLSRPPNYPPGPPALPFFGNLLSLGGRPERKILEWKEKYGDVLGMFNGRTRVVVLSDFHTLRKVFSEDNASGRHTHSVLRTEANGLPMGSGLLTSQETLWKSQRRFALSTLRDLGMGKNWLEDTIIAEVESLCQVLRDTKEAPFNPKVHLTNSVSNVICALIFGKRFELTDPKFSRLTGLITENVATIKLDFVASTLPFLLWFPNFIEKKIRQAQCNVKALMTFLGETAREHAGTMDRQTESPDYLYAYQKEAEMNTNHEGPGNFDERQLVSSLFDLFFAGTETTSTTVLWAMVFMIENPDVMQNVQDEIDENVGREKILTSSDRVRLPYTEAVILEVQRCANLVPLGVPHRSHEDIQVDGYTIPKDTLIVANLFSIHRDPRYWKDPEQFDAFRFLKDDKKLIRPDGFAPFLIGKRACLGEALAKMELFLFIANLLRCFRLELPEGKTLSHKNYVSSIVNSPVPFELVFIPRD